MILFSYSIPENSFIQRNGYSLLDWQRRMRMTKVDFCKSNCTNKYQKKLLPETLYFYPQWMEKNNIFTSKRQITISFKNFII